MPQPAVARLRRLLPPPVSGGDAVDRGGLAVTAQSELPSG